MAAAVSRPSWRTSCPKLEAVISQRICVKELELNLTSYLLFRGSKLTGFERFFDLDLITMDKLRTHFDAG